MVIQRRKENGRAPRYRTLTKGRKKRKSPKPVPNVKKSHPCRNESSPTCIRPATLLRFGQWVKGYVRVRTNAFHVARLLYSLGRASYPIQRNPRYRPIVNVFSRHNAGGNVALARFQVKVAVCAPYAPAGGTNCIALVVSGFREGWKIVPVVFRVAFRDPMEENSADEYVSIAACITELSSLSAYRRINGNDKQTHPGSLPLMIIKTVRLATVVNSVPKLPIKVRRATFLNFLVDVFGFLNEYKSMYSQYDTFQWRKAGSYSSVGPKTAS